ncbi:MAG: hypothetical protein CMF22_11255 [Idiomarinaceae bacterium]|nr:hypothetical protein [Idiomarinaceae bacterium]|tara:strand:+ start:135710 stop:138730 length:3021 start_codon:yes stop_codon:yes gene_type:complete
MNQMAKALRYAENGMRVFPCSPRTKSPVIRGGGGFKSATTDLKTIEAWWKKHPNALIGHPNENFVTIDIDDYNIPYEVDDIVREACEDLKKLGIWKDNDFTVSTKSGGTHVYLRVSSPIRRNIKSLPQIDLLAGGGYVILPDQEKYVAEGTDAPWDDLPKITRGIDIAGFEKLSNKYQSLHEYVRDTVKKYRNSAAGKSLGARGKKAKLKQGDKKKAVFNTVQPKKTPDGKFDDPVFDSVPKSAREQELDAREKHLLERERDLERFEAYHSERGEDISLLFSDTAGKTQTTNPSKPYKAVNESTSKDKSTYRSPRESLLDEDGKYPVDLGSMKEGETMMLFHNAEVQRRIATALGFPVPDGFGRSGWKRFKSPLHADHSPSMGVRWSADKSHLIYRDFSNQAGCRAGYTDYNLMSLWASSRYEGFKIRMSAIEFNIWFMRALHEAGIIDVTPLMRHSWIMEPENRAEAIACGLDRQGKKDVAINHVYNGIVLLDAIKRAYHRYDDELLFSQRFAAAWINMKRTTASSGTFECLFAGAIEFSDRYHFGRDDNEKKDGFFSSRLLKIALERPAFKFATNAYSTRDHLDRFRGYLGGGDVTDEDVLNNLDMIISMYSKEIARDYGPIYTAMLGFRDIHLESPKMSCILSQELDDDNTVDEMEARLDEMEEFFIEHSAIFDAEDWVTEAEEEAYRWEQLCAEMDELSREEEMQEFFEMEKARFFEEESALDDGAPDVVDFVDPWEELDAEMRKLAELEENPLLARAGADRVRALVKKYRARNPQWALEQHEAEEEAKRKEEEMKERPPIKIRDRLRAKYKHETETDKGETPLPPPNPKGEEHEHEDRYQRRDERNDGIRPVRRGRGSGLHQRVDEPQCHVPDVPSPVRGDPEGCGGVPPEEPQYRDSGGSPDQRGVIPPDQELHRGSRPRDSGESGGNVRSDSPELSLSANRNRRLSAEPYVHRRSIPSGIRGGLSDPRRYDFVGRPDPERDESSRSTVAAPKESVDGVP